MLTSEELAARVHTIGASEVPAILGIHPWQSPINVWLRKAPPGGKPPIDVTDSSSEATEMGDDFEEVVLRRLSKQYGIALCRDRETFALDDNPRLTATPDALVYESFGDADGVRCEIVTSKPLPCAESKLVGAGPAAHWIDPDTKEKSCPEYVIAQAQWQMGVTGLPLNYVGEQIASTKWASFEIAFDADLFDEMRVDVERFIHDHVDRQEPPSRAANEDRIEYLRKRFPRSDGTLEIVDALPPELAELVREYTKLGEKLSDYEHEQQECKAAILEIIGERDGFKGPWGTLSFKTQKGRAQYKRIAEFLCGGEIREDLLMQFRGEDFRVFRCAIK